MIIRLLRSVHPIYNFWSEGVAVNWIWFGVWSNQSLISDWPIVLVLSNQSDWQIVLVLSNQSDWQIVLVLSNQSDWQIVLVLSNQSDWSHNLSIPRLFVQPITRLNGWSEYSGPSSVPRSNLYDVAIQTDCPIYWDQMVHPILRLIVYTSVPP